MIVNNIVDGQERLSGIKYFINWKGGQQEGHLDNLSYTELHVQTPFDITVLGQPVTFTVSLKNITSDNVCITSSWGGKGLVLSQAVVQSASKAK